MYNYKEAKASLNVEPGAPYPETETDYLVKLLLTNHQNIFLEYINNNYNPDINYYQNILSRLDFFRYDYVRQINLIYNITDLIVKSSKIKITKSDLDYILNNTNINSGEKLDTVNLIINYLENNYTISPIIQENYPVLELHDYTKYLYPSK